MPRGAQSEERSETRVQESELMKSDTEIRDDVIKELQWDPQITNPDAIGVAVTDGAVTLTGQVPTYAERLAAARAAERVYGVKAVANELKVKLAGAPQEPERRKRGIDLTNAALGWPVGRLYVQRYFPAEAKAKARAMVTDLVKAFGRRIDALDWMSAATKAKAKEKPQRERFIEAARKIGVDETGQEFERLFR